MKLLGTEPSLQTRQTRYDGMSFHRSTANDQADSECSTSEVEPSRHRRSPEIPELLPNKPLRAFD